MTTAMSMLKTNRGRIIFAALVLLLNPGVGIGESSAPGQAVLAPGQSKPAPRHRIDLLDLKEMDTTDVLKLISQKTGLNIIAGNNVTGKVTIYLKDVAVDEVLGILCDTNDLAYVEEEGLIHVMTAADYERKYGRRFNPKTRKKIVKLNDVSVAHVLPVLEKLKGTNGAIVSDERTNTLVLTDTAETIGEMETVLKEIDTPRTTEVFDLNYARAEEISEKVEALLTPNVGSLRFDKRSNKLSVTDIPPKLSEIAKVISAFDVKEKQVAIEAKIVQVILSDQFKMGIDWQAMAAKYHNLRMAGNLSLLSDVDKKGTIAIGTLSDDSYSVMIQALKEYGDTNNLSNPHIMAVNNEEAKILVGSTEPYVTTTTTTPAAGPATTAESVNFIEVGVKLYVTPIIHNDGYITMKIKPEVSSVTRTIATANNNTIPVVDTSEAETTVIAKDGVTIILGGLIKDELVNTDKKVPLLGDVPFMGALFRSQNHLTRKTELVIFLTPRIVTGDTPALSREKVTPP